MIDVSIDIADLRKVIRRVGQAPQQLRHMRNLSEEIAQLMQEQTQTRIRKEKRAPDNTPWQKWSEAYAKTRTGKDSLLIDTRKLLKSIEADGTEDEITIRSDLPYAGVHQDGGGNNIPARPYLGVSQKNTKQIDRMLNEWLEELI